MSYAPNRYAISSAATLFALTALAIGVVWWRLGTPVTLPYSPLASGGKLYCVSYAPFRDGQDPLIEGMQVEPGQIDEDLTMLAKYTDCIRTYSVANGLDKIPEIAQRHGLKVLQGVWLSSNLEKNRQQISTSVALANKYPDVISAVVVGNEVLLRGEMSVPDLMAAIREVKSQISQPVTYADVWEYWLRYQDVANAVDFITIHILPYWEDFPLPASVAAAHVDAIRKQVAAAFPNKEIFVGEVGWPSAGRMREGARPSPSNQARVIEDTLTLAQREHFRVNVIEAFDQPWKRWLEGSVGGHWGIFDRTTQVPKFSFGGAVSDHPQWRFQALAGILLAALTFGSAFAAAREKGATSRVWYKVALIAFLPAILFGWTIETVPTESFGVGGWLRSLTFVAVAFLAPIVCANACVLGRAPPSFSLLLGHPDKRQDALNWALGGTFIVLTLLSVQAALGLVFDPRYREIPFAPQGAACVPFLVLQLSAMTRAGSRAAAETMAAVVLAVSAIYIAFNETFANWQAIWFCAGLIGLAFILQRVRLAPG